MKRIKIAVVMAGMLLLTGCGMMQKTPENQKVTTDSDAKISEEGKQNNTLSGPTAMELSHTLGPGWNLGNALDCVADKTFTTEDINYAKNDYQIMATYATEPYTGWDASPVPYFADTDPINTYELEWKIDSLTSSLDSTCGKFGIQLINHTIGTNWNATVKFDVKKAEFETVTGQIVQLNDMKGSYEKNFTDGSTAFVFTNLGLHSALQQTKDLLGGTLRVTVEITRYPEVSSTYTDAGTYYETYWGNPVTTKKMIDMVKEAGFNAVRIPVTYTNHMDASMNIDKEWLARVAEVVNYAYSNDMYVIINVHHDRKYVVASGKNLDTYKKNLSCIWGQVAEYFQNYNDKLIFEGFNEILNEQQNWTSPSLDELEAVNALNQTFVDTVRKSGGNNGTRYLWVAPYATGTDQTFLEAFRMPTDTVSDRLMVDVHTYDIENLSAVFNRLTTYFTKKNIPVVIGEWAIGTKSDKNKRINVITEFQTLCSTNKIASFWWDSGNVLEQYLEKNEDSYSLLDRKNMEWYDQDIVNTFTRTYKID